MKRLRGVLLVGAFSLAAVLAAPSAVSAEETTCRGSIGSRTVDNLRVPSGATCTLNGTRVEGTIKVARNATLYAYGVRVKGNVQGEEAARVRVLADSRVNGSIQLDDGGNARIRYSHIGGSIQLKANDGWLLLERNTVGADVQAFSNSGGVKILRNRIDGNLQCKSNEPRPTGGNNVVEGNKEDQCRRL
jgi:hypothetical protein